MGMLVSSVVPAKEPYLDRNAYGWEALSLRLFPYKEGDDNGHSR